MPSGERSGPRLNLTPAISNIPGNMSAMSLSPGGYNGSTTSLTNLVGEKVGSGGSLSVVKEGFARVKMDGMLSFVWTEKYLILRENQLDFHKTYNSPKISFSISLREVTNVTRSETYPLSFEITRLSSAAAGAPGAPKTVICKVDTDDQIYAWIDSIYERCPGMGGVSNPTNFSHQVHVGFDPVTGAFLGLPPEWEKLLTNSAISKEDYSKNPTAVIEVLNFYTEKLVKGGQASNNSYANMSSNPAPNTLYSNGGGNSIAPPRPKPPAVLGRLDSNDPRGNQPSSGNTTPINESPMTPHGQQPQFNATQQEQRRRMEEEARKIERQKREQRERDEQRRREQDRREREEQTAYNNSLPKSRLPTAQQEIGGGNLATNPNGQRNQGQYTAARTAPSAPGANRPQQGNGQSTAPKPPAKSDSPVRQPYATDQRPRSPASKPNGSSPVATRIPVVTKEGQSTRGPGHANGAAPKPLNVTVKQATGAAAVAEAARKLETQAPKKEEGRREMRMSSMTEAEVMTRLREVVSKELVETSYNKQKKIGQGASGSVYVARVRESATSPAARQVLKNQGPRAQVAIKQMDLRNQPRKELIVNEIVVMKDSKHPNIVNFIEAFLSAEQTDLMVIMEFMEGGPLTDVIDNNNSISEDQIATICYEVRLCLFF